MSSASRRPRRGSANASPWATLPPGVQAGLARLVADNRSTVASMLQAGEKETNQQVCDRCAGVMRQQQLSAGAFLGRFFPAEILSAHAELLGRSGKGGAATLADRIHACWTKGPIFPAGPSREPDSETVASPSASRKSAKRAKLADCKSTASVPATTSAEVQQPVATGSEPCNGRANTAPAHQEL